MERIFTWFMIGSTLQFFFRSSKNDEVVVRKPTIEDANEITNALQDKTIYNFIHSIPYPYTIDNAKEYIEFSNSQEKEHKLSNFTIVVNGVPCGMTGLMLDDPRHGELGYWLNNSYRGRGIVSTAVKHMIIHGFEDLNLEQIKLRIFKENISSIRIMEKLGIPKYGMLEKEIFYHDKFWDINIYVINSNEIETYKKKWDL